MGNFYKLLPAACLFVKYWALFF